MTFREKLKKEKPGYVGDIYVGGARGCPCDYGYESVNNRPCETGGSCRCEKCWDREIPDTEPTVREEKPEIRPIDPSHVFNEMAKVHRACYDSYRNFGFTDEQAFGLVCILFERDVKKRETTLL